MENIVDRNVNADTKHSIKHTLSNEIVIGIVVKGECINIISINL